MQNLKFVQSEELSVLAAASRADSEAVTFKGNAALLNCSIFSWVFNIYDVGFARQFLLGITTSN